MSSNNSNHITEELVSQVASILKLGKIKHFGYDELLIKCPFCRARAHSLFVNIATGEYYCVNCGIMDNFRTLDIELPCSTFEEVTENIIAAFSKPRLSGSFLLLPFENKNLTDILNLTSLKPSIIFTENDNSNNFCLLYYFSNLQPDTRHNELIALRLLADFRDSISKNIPSDEEVISNYSITCTNNVFYKVIDHYSDTQIDTVIQLFDRYFKGGNINE